MVQLPAGEVATEQVSGRVEHILTGRSARFDSLEGLADFFAAVLAGDTVRDRGES